MNENELLAEKFDERRPHLRAVAYRMLGSLSEADDAVQEAWLRSAPSIYLAHLIAFDFHAQDITPFQPGAK